MSQDSHKHVAFVGTPNSGKTTLFNVLTGMRKKVGNFPGITIEPSLGIIKKDSSNHSIIDLPGCYSLIPTSLDEELTLQVLKNEHALIASPRGIVFVMDATNLDKSLYLYSEVAELGIDMIIALTMVDGVKARSGVIDDIALERLTGLTVIPIVGHKGIGVETLRETISDDKSWKTPIAPPTFEEIRDRIHWVKNISNSIINMKEFDRVTQKLDAVLLHPIGGILSFLCIMALFFQSIFSWAVPFMDMIEYGFSSLEHFVLQSMPQGILSDLIARGLIAGVGSVIVFLPQIIILNVFVVILEDCGYLARAAFLIDRLMGVFGLQGRSFIPLLGSYACAIPGIISARIIPSHRDRMTTMLIAPLMTCSARLPVYTLIISAFIPPMIVGGIFSLQAVILAGLYALGGITGLIVAFIMKKSLFKGDVIPFLIEFPPYRMPSLKSMAVSVSERAIDFLKSAGTVIVTLSLILWCLSAFPRMEINPLITPIEQQQMQLEQSYAGMIGKSIAPVFEPLGFDWKLTVGVLGSFAAREVFVTVMGQLYGTDTTDSDTTLRSTLQQTIPFASALSVLAFYVYALQCISTMSILKRETGSWKWPAFAFAYMFALAYVCAFIVYSLAA
ncbi:MAG: ferrous iron transporter B [bacterium]